jgi:predicted Zn finger-like uncharacterized protein
MRLTCPNCGARYEVDDALIPPEGRDVQCSDCVTTWFQAGPRKPLQEQPSAPRPPFPEPAAPDIEEADTQGALEAAATETPAEPATEEVERPLEQVPESGFDPTTDEDAAYASEQEESAPIEEGLVTEGPVSDTPESDMTDLVAETEAPPDPDLPEAVEQMAVATEDAADDNLAEIPQSAESATQVVAENDAADIDEDEATAEPAGRRAIDPDVRDILRSEAEREAKLRKAEADPVETQAEMPLEQSSDEPARARRRMDLEDAQDAYTVGAASAGHANGSRRDLLPDIEEINSTLRATEDRGAEEGDDAARLNGQPHTTAQGRADWFFPDACTDGRVDLGLFQWRHARQNVCRPLPVRSTGFTAQVDGARLWLDDLARGLATSEED